MTRESDKNCPTCTDFKDWMEMNKINKKNKIIDKETKNQNLINENNNYDGPLYRNQLGKFAWSYLHTMAAYYPSKPTKNEQTSMIKFIETFAMFFPCQDCASDFQKE